MAEMRTVAPQDDAREQEQLKIFGLKQEPLSSREENDALLDLPNLATQKLELKSTTKKSITTARDFGLNHINSWRKKHLLCSFYDSKGNQLHESLLIPNIKLQDWLNQQLHYIKVDREIINALNHKVDEAFLGELRTMIFDEQKTYSSEILDDLLKKQISNEEKKQFLDINGSAISPASLNAALKKRLEYLLFRGTTRNNPHIGVKFIKDIIKQDPDLRFEHHVGDYQSSYDWIRVQLEKYAI